MTEADRADDNKSALTYHRIIEAFKYGYAGRAHLGDPDFSGTYTNITEVSPTMT
jgi:gamma-glutamyltranspeptidase/glutathione hydrolase/leukotriene-C4 hydrolase